MPEDRPTHLGPEDDRFSHLRSDLAGRAVDVVELVASSVHDSVIRPTLVAVRAVVFGLIAAVAATVVITAFAVGLVRLLDVYAFGGRVWASDALLAFVLTVAGAGAWSRRDSPSGGQS